MKEFYNYEIELSDGSIITDHNNFDFNKVVRISYIPTIGLLPRHDIIFNGFKFKKRFSRGFVGLSKGMREYLHCVVTNKFRMYIKSSTGQVIITPYDYEMYL